MSGYKRMARNSELTDSDLLRASVDDPEAFGQFYDRHFQSVLTYFCRRTTDPHQAADLTAETFAKALLSCHRFRDNQGSAVGWLFGIAHHELTGMFRKTRSGTKAMKRLRVSYVSLDDDSLERIERLIDAQADIIDLRVALKTLPRTLADAVTLRIGHEMPFQEVANHLGCSTAAARVRVSRGLLKLTEAVCA